MPSLLLRRPKLSPSSAFSTTNAEIPCVPASGSVDRHHRVVLRDAGVGDPALDPVEHPAVAVADGPGLHRRRVAAGLRLGQAVGEHRLAARQPAAGTRCLSSSLPASSSPIVPSLLTAGISDDDAQARATSSITIAAASASAPGTAVLARDVHRVEVRGDQGVERPGRELECSSTSAAGARSSPCRAREPRPDSRCSSGSRYTSKSGHRSDHHVRPPRQPAPSHRPGHIPTGPVHLGGRSGLA